MKGTLNKSLNLIFPKYVNPQSLSRLACLAESDIGIQIRALP